MSSRTEAPHKAGATADGVVEERPRFTSAKAALANVTKVAQIRATAVAQVEHLDERLAAALDEAVEAGATKTAARKAAEQGAKS